MPERRLPLLIVRKREPQNWKSSHCAGKRNASYAGARRVSKIRGRSHMRRHVRERARQSSDRTLQHYASGNFRSFLLICVICVICGLICGLSLSCAAQSPPRPPRIQQPQSVKDLNGAQVGTAIELHFTLPDTATDGEGLTKPLEIDIVRAITPPGGNSRAPASEAPLATLRGTDLARHTSAGKVEFTDSLSRDDFQRLAGSTLTYRVRGLTRGFRGRPIESALSSPAALPLLDVPEPPSGLSVEETASALRLRWSVPTKTVSGKAAGPADVYRIYRSDTGKLGPYHPAGESHDDTFSDASFEFGQLYAYRVRAVMVEAGHRAESADSDAVEIAPRAVFPPAPPAGLTGLYTANGVELIWNPSPAPELAGYNIYRAAAGASPVRLNTSLLRSPLYRDTAVTSGGRYTYRVTAVDSNGNESAPSAEIAIEAQ